MAREITVIQQQIINDLVARAAAVGVVIRPDEWSDYDYRQLLTYVTAVADGTLEQLWDVYQNVIGDLVAEAPPQTPLWLQKQMRLFQFSATDPQVLQLDETTFAPAYPTVNAALRVIGYCTVTPGPFGTTTIKVAASVDGAPENLETAYPDALAAAQTYANLLGFPGLIYNVQTGTSDKIAITASIYYVGAYSAVIKANVIAAINNYLNTIPFNGVALLTGIEDAIKHVAGVSDFIINEVQARANGTAYGSGTFLVLANTTNQRKWNTVAGFIRSETTSGHTLEDTLTFIAE